MTFLGYRRSYTPPNLRQYGPSACFHWATIDDAVVTLLCAMLQTTNLDLLKLVPLLPHLRNSHVFIRLPKKDRPNHSNTKHPSNSFLTLIWPTRFTTRPKPVRLMTTYQLNPIPWTTFTEPRKIFPTKHPDTRHIPDQAKDELHIY